MKNFSGHSYGFPMPDDSPSLLAEDLKPVPTFGLVMGQVGGVLAVCLCLGLVAHLLVALLGGQ
jgi:hypothetical protein